MIASSPSNEREELAMQGEAPCNRPRDRQERGDDARDANRGADRRAAGRPTRRRVLADMLAGALVAGAMTVAAACKSRDKARSAGGPDHAPNAHDSPHEPGADAAPVGPRAQLAAIVAAIAPWPADQRELADEFTQRYLTPARLARHGESGDALASVAGKLAGSSAIPALDLGAYSEAERALLLAVVHEVYGFDDIRCVAAGQPPIGVCIGNLVWHTVPPSR